MLEELICFIQLQPLSGDLYWILTLMLRYNEEGWFLNNNTNNLMCKKADSYIGDGWHINNLYMVSFPGILVQNIRQGMNIYCLYSKDYIHKHVIALASGSTGDS